MRNLCCLTSMQWRIIKSVSCSVQIIGNLVVCSTACSGKQTTKEFKAFHYCPFVSGIHWSLMDSLYKGGFPTQRASNVILSCKSPGFNELSHYGLLQILKAWHIMMKIVPSFPIIMDNLAVILLQHLCLYTREMGRLTDANHHCGCWCPATQITRFMGPTWGPPGSCRPQMGPMLAPWALLSG